MSSSAVEQSLDGEVGKIAKLSLRRAVSPALRWLLLTAHLRDSVPKILRVWQALEFPIRARWIPSQAQENPHH